MRNFARIWILLLTLHVCFCLVFECPSTCTCYIWHNLYRIDCVKKGLLDVNIGLNEDVNYEGRMAKEVRMSVRVLDLTHNSISVLGNDAFLSGNLNHLEALHLSYNSIAHISPSAFQGLTQLKLLDLSHNRLRRLPAIDRFTLTPVLLPEQIFEDVPNLRVLRLGFNPLEKEDHHGKNDNVDGKPLLIAPHLEHLDLGSCHLGHVDKYALIGLHSIKTLNLSDNQLITLDPSALHSLKNLKKLLLSNNPWPCQNPQDLATLESWVLTHGFDRICPIIKLEKMEAVDPNILGPQKAEDDDSLLYYYQFIGIVTKDEDVLMKNQHSDSVDLKDVEIFDEEKIKNSNTLSNLEPDPAILNDDKDSEVDLKCSVDGIPVAWFIAFAFQAGVLVSFVCTFCWLNQPYKGMCVNWRATIRIQPGRSANVLRKNKTFSKQLSSVISTQCENEGEGSMLLTDTEGDMQNPGSTTPILQRAVNTLKSDSSTLPSYEEHLALHAIRVD